MTEVLEKPFERNPLFYSPRGLLDFQVDPIALGVIRPANFVGWDTGLGKSIYAMAVSAFLEEDGLIDHVLIICEQLKVSEWVEDFSVFTRIPVVKYHGVKAKREKLRKSLPRVIVTTYETAKLDLVKVEYHDDKKITSLNPLGQLLDGKRVLVVFDEMTAKLGNRKSNLYKDWNWWLTRMRKTGSVRVIGLSADSMERWPVNFFNLGLLLMPDFCTVKEFERRCIRARDEYGVPNDFHNLDWLAAKMAPVMLRKRKTDPDVAHLFPTPIEDPKKVELSEKHLRFYRTVQALIEDSDNPFDEESAFSLKRIAASYPLAISRLGGAVARAVTAAVGVEGLRALGSVKRDRLIEYLKPILNGQGDQVLAFTYFANSILPLLADDLRASGWTVATNSGSMTNKQTEESIAAFKSGQAQIFLSSDKGQRGINLPEASYVINFEPPPKWTSYHQRMSRGSRLGHGGGFLVAMTLIARNTIDMGVARLMAKRNAWSNELFRDDEAEGEFVPAAIRREWLLD